MPIFAPLSAVANIAFDKNDTLVASEPKLNLIEGANISLTITDNAASNRIDVTVDGVTTSYQQALAALNPVSYWHLNEAVGTTAADANSLVNGTYVNSPTLGQASLISSGGTSVNISGTQSVTLGTASYRFAGILPFTWLCWVDVTSDTTVGHYLVNRSFSDGSGTQGYLLQLRNYDASGGYAALLRYRNGVVVSADSATPIPLGTRAMVAATYDGTNSKVYVNGSLAGTGATDTAAIVDGSTTLYLGNSSDSLRPLLGLLDEVAVWTRALAASEIAVLYSAGL